MSLGVLRDAHPGSSAAKALSEAQVNQVRLRYEAFFAQARGMLDGEWAWEDTSAGYLLLDSLALREETSGLARFLFEDFAHYFTTRKPRGQLCVLIVDEFSALASNAGMAGRVEQARGFNTGLVLAPQVVAGMGDPVEAARILGSVQTVICHRVNTPEEIITLAGTRRVVEYSSHYAIDGATGEGSARMQHQYKVDPNHVRSLPPGMAYIISQGHAMKAQVQQAPTLVTQPPDGMTTIEPDAPEDDLRPPPANNRARAPHRDETATADLGAPSSVDGVPPSGGRSEKGVDDLPF